MFYLGMDVAKAKPDCCLLLDEACGKRKTKVASNTRPGIVDLLAWVPGNMFLLRTCMPSWKPQACITSKLPTRW